MARAFRRSVVIDIDGVESLSTFDNLVRLGTGINPTPLETIDYALREFHYRFEVVKNLKTDFNRMELEIYNVNQETAKKVDKLDTNISLSAGYIEEDNIKRIFKGVVTKVEYDTRGVSALNNNKDDKNVGTGSNNSLSTGSGTENILKIKALDGGDLRDVDVDISYWKGGFNAREDLQVGGVTVIPSITLSPLVTAQGSVDRLARDLGYKIDRIPFGFSNNQFYPTGFSFDGPAIEAFQELADKMDCEFSIQNGKLLFLPDGVPTDTRIEPLFGDIDIEGTIISYGNGLLAQPQRLGEIRERIKGNRLEQGYKLVSLLRPDINPGMRIRIAVEDFESDDYRVEEVRHVGSPDGDWNTEIEVRGLAGPNTRRLVQLGNFEEGRTG